jgi:hypothetical protein
MKHTPRDFKQTPVFDWATEPKDERPSEFVPSTGYSSLSGYYAMPPSSVPVRRENRSALSSVALAAVLSLLIGAAGLYGMVHWLRG